jgi:hypothetical protein
MRALNRKIGKATAAALIFVSLFLGLQAFALRGGTCEEALSRCLDDVFTQAFGSFGMVYCAIGFAFCKRYIDPAG